MNEPASPNERRFCTKLLESLRAPFSPSGRLVSLETVAMRVLRQLEPKMFIIDGAHYLLAGSYRDNAPADLAESPRVGPRIEGAVGVDTGVGES